MDSFLAGINESDLSFEEELGRNAYAVKTWWQYIHSKGDSERKAKSLLFERALKLLPGSYKLWHAYLQHRVAGAAKYNAVGDPRREAVNNVFERALVFMHKMPVIWREYCAFLSPQCQITRTRRTFDRALQALPVTQHDQIWPLYLQFATDCGVRQTCVAIYRRYLQFDPSGREKFVSYLVSIGHWDEAASQIATLVNDEHFVSKEGKTKHSFWMQLCDVVSQHPLDIKSLRVEPILRAGIARFSDETGRLWCALAEYYVRQGLFELARDIYEEGLGAVRTVRDFATVFDAYSQFEEALLTAKIELQEAGEGSNADDESGSNSSSSASAASAAARGDRGVVSSANDLEPISTLSSEGGSDLEPVSTLSSEGGSGGSGGSTADDGSRGGGGGGDIELRMARLELLLDRRPILLNSVLLRQNPNNVGEWLKRAQLHQDTGASAARVIAVFAEAVRTVDPSNAINGKPYTLWTAFARFYEGKGDLDNARAVFRRATQQEPRVRSVDDLAALWCEWAETEIRAQQYDRARRLMEQATTPPQSSASNSSSTSRANGGGGGAGGAGQKMLTDGDDNDDEEEGGDSGQKLSAAADFRRLSSAHASVYRSLRLWALYLDLEESLGTVQSVKDAYDRCIGLGIATPIIVLNYASYLQERQYFEDSFKAYEKGLAAFPWPLPHAKEIWAAYLTKFLERYGGSKVERTRDLFEQCLTSGCGCPADSSAVFWKMYANFEEQHGMVRHAMAIYDRACEHVSQEQRYDMFLAYLRKAEEHYGAPKTRPIYEKAVEALPDAQVKDMCMRFAAMETKLGEIDRARAIYVHASQFCDPAVAHTFWQAWQDFEVKHGSEDTFRETLRIKRSVAAQFSSASAAITDLLKQAEKASAPAPRTATASATAAVSSASSGGAAPGQKRPASEMMMMTAMTAMASSGGNGGYGEDDDSSSSQARPAKHPRLDEEDSASSARPAGAVAGAGGGAGSGGAEEIDLDAVEEKAVPAAVFGGLLGAQDNNNNNNAAGGALQRLKAAGATS